MASKNLKSLANSPSTIHVTNYVWCLVWLPYSTVESKVVSPSPRCTLQLDTHVPNSLIDEDQDSLFGSPPPSPVRGRSPSQETLVAGGEIGPIIAVPSTEVGRKNVGTIALPGSHMSCAELPADLPASSLSLPRPSSNRDSSNIVTSRSSTRSVLSRDSSVASTIPPACASTRKRRTPKSKSVTPVSTAPPIPLPGPNEPTPPNFLRSQSSLLGLAGLVGCVKPAQLYSHPQPTPVQQSRSHSPICGSTPTHPIVLDDDDDAPHIGKRSCSQLQMPQTLDQLDPDTLRSNIMNSLAKEKNILPVLESLIKLLGGEPHLPPPNPPPRPFARPYGNRIFNMQPSPFIPPRSASGVSTTTSAVPPPKRRKLKHVPAGAVDWDIPFPFAPGEGPEAYRDTWARDRTKQLATQLLKLVKNAAKRAAIKTARNGGKVSTGQARAQSSRSASIETQIGEINSAQHSTSHCTGKEASVRESPLNTIMIEQAGISVDNLVHYLGSLETPSTTGSSDLGSKDGMSVDSEGTVEDGLVASCDYSAFEAWLSQLQQFVPLEPNAPIPESDWDTRPSVSLSSSASSPAPDIQVSAPHTMGDEAIDPALLAISQQSASAPQYHSSTLPMSARTLGDISPALDISTTPPALAHSPRTSLSSFAEPLTPLSEAFVDVPTSTITHQDSVRGTRCIL
ncbi:hypothetical protein EV363DRAFT_1415691 [Boletus edulis]|nr:hypothetical protein EV363DRAFT_1415691 [Boletus edulis]